MFKAMLSDQKDSVRPKGDQQDVPLVLADVTPEIFMSLLEFLYTNTCTLNSKNVSGNVLLTYNFFDIIQIYKRMFKMLKLLFEHTCIYMHVY